MGLRPHVDHVLVEGARPCVEVRERPELLAAAHLAVEGLSVALEVKEAAGLA